MLALFLYLSAGLTLFVNLKKYHFNSRNGYVSSVYLPLFLGCILAWPAFGLYALVKGD